MYTITAHSRMSRYHHSAAGLHQVCHVGRDPEPAAPEGGGAARIAVAADAVRAAVRLHFIPRWRGVDASVLPRAQRNGPVSRKSCPFIDACLSCRVAGMSRRPFFRARRHHSRIPDRHSRSVTRAAVSPAVALTAGLDVSGTQRRSRTMTRGPTSCGHSRRARTGQPCQRFTSPPRTSARMAQLTRRPCTSCSGLA